MSAAARQLAPRLSLATCMDLSVRTRLLRWDGGKLLECVSTELRRPILSLDELSEDEGDQVKSALETLIQQRRGKV